MYNLTLSIDHPYAASGGTYADQAGTIQLVSGSAYVIVHDFNTVSNDVIAHRDRLLTRYTHDGLADESEPVRGEGLWLMGLAHQYEERLFAELLGQTGNIHFVRHHTVGLLGQEETYFMDLFLSITSAKSASNGAKSMPGFRTLVLMSSALEHGALEQTQGSDRDAVSTVKVLRLNNADGDMTFLADAGNWSSVKPNLQNYHPTMISEIESRIYAGRTILLPQNGAIQLNQWHGAGFISYADTGSMEMIIGGGLYGGSGTGGWDILIASLRDLLKEMLGELFDQLEIEIPDSDDPVDMYSGAFRFDSLDLVAGPNGFLDLAFGRAYSSGRSYNLGPMGYGWSHTQQASLAFHHDYRAGLGRRQPTDAAALITFAHVLLDALDHEETIEGWLVADLAAHWAMDQLIDNAVTAHFGATTAEYVLMPDGSYNPPPGLYWQLLKKGDYYYAQGEGNTCMIFDAEGRGRIWTDANGNTLTYAYNGEGRLLSVDNPDLGQSLVFTYTGDLLTAVADQAGRTVSFEYTEDELTTFRDAEGLAHHYHYDDGHRLVSVTRPEGNTVVTNAYDDLGRVITQTDALSHTTTFYFSGYRNVEVTADGGRMIHYFNAQGHTTGNENGQGHRTLMVYDGLSHLRSLTDRLGETTTYTYDPVSGQIATITNPAGETLSYTYTPVTYTCTNPLDDQSVTLTTYALGRAGYADGSHETLTYDDQGNLLTHTDLGGHTWQYQHNARGQQTVVTNPTGGATTYTYNADGTLASSTDSDTGVTTYGYEAYLRQNRITHPDGNTVETVFDLNNRITSVTDERGHTTTYEYDANGNLLRSVDPLGAETTYLYNAMDQRTQKRSWRGTITTYTYDERNRLASVTDPNGNTTHYRYDTHGRVTEIVDPEGHTLENEYNAEGRNTASTTPLGHTTTFQYNTQGRPIATLDPLGHVSTLMRDALGRITASADAEGRTTQYTYSALGQTIGVRLPSGETVTYGYNALGLLTSARDPGGHTWSFAHSPMGQLESRTDPLGHQWTYDYNPRGFLTHVTYPTGDETTMTYDKAGNLLRQQHSAGPDLAFAYDALNRVIATNGISLTYNASSQVIATTDWETRHLFGAAYDDGGRLETVSYPSTSLRAGADGLFTVTYQYNARDLLTRVSDDLTGASVQFTYDDDGRLTGVQRSNGVNATFTWDNASRLTHIQDGALIDLQYTHSAADEVTQAVMNTPVNPADYVITETLDYAFDAASQLSNPGFAYDALGRLTTDPQHSYTWDGVSRLTGVDAVSLTYNGFGDLLTRTESGQTTRTFYNHALGLTPVVAERDVDAGTFQQFYVWTPSGALLYAIDAQDGNEVTFYHFDRSGSTLALTDAAGNLTDAYAYDPYGRLLHHQGSHTQPFTYVGQWGVRQEGTSGAFYQMRARYYDAITGRFLSREPLWPQVGNAQALNPYQYAYQNPGTYVDVTGLMPTPAEYAQRLISQASSVIDDEEVDRINRNVIAYTARWHRQQMGDPANYEPTPKQHLEWLVLRAGPVIDGEEMTQISEESNLYINEWVRRNVGDPDKYALPPDGYLRWLMREAGEVIDEREMAQIDEKWNSYTNEWIRRNVGDPDKYELTPEQYLWWLQRNAGSMIGQSEADAICAEIERYTQGWIQHQKAIQYLKLEPSVPNPRPRNAPHPIRLGGYYGRMP